MVEIYPDIRYTRQVKIVNVWMIFGNGAFGNLGENKMVEYFRKLYRGDQQTFFHKVSYSLDQEDKMFIVTANPETLMIGYENNAFHSVLVNDSTTIVPDGIGVVKAANLLGIPIRERITGVELVAFLFREADRMHKKVFLYGAKDAIIKTLVKKLSREYPNIIISGYHDGYSGDRDEILQSAIARDSDIILVALGIPNQELLIDRHFSDATKGIFIGVGGSFDVISGMKRRAPRFFINHNLEWFYRIFREPKRIKRFYKSNVKFMWKVHQMRERGFSCEQYNQSNDNIRDTARNH